MEIHFKDLINKNKSFTVFYLVWFLFHLSIFVTRVEEPARGGYWRDVSETKSVYVPKVIITDSFWPIGSFELSAYDKTEFIFYLLLPIILFIIWKLINADIKRLLSKLHEKNQKRTRKKDNSTIKNTVPLPNEKEKKFDSPMVTNNKRSKRTIKKLIIFWTVLIGILISNALVNSFYTTLSGKELFSNTEDNLFIYVGRLWILINMFVFAFVGLNSSRFLNQNKNKKSSIKVLLGMLWWFLGFISIWLFTIPIIIQNNNVRKREKIMTLEENNLK